MHIIEIGGKRWPTNQERGPIEERIATALNGDGLAVIELTGNRTLIVGPHQHALVYEANDRSDGGTVPTR